MSDAPNSLAALERTLRRERLARKRAEELLETRSRELYHSKAQLEEAYSSTVEVFASIVAGRRGRDSKSLRQLGREARRLATLLDLSNERAEVCYLAAILCDMGKLALPDEIVGKPFFELDRNESSQFGKHPQFAHDALLALPPLEAVAQTILEHCELFDGSGYPNRLTWDKTAVESQLLCVVKDFDALINGVLFPEKLTVTEAIEYMRSQVGKRYGVEIVDAYIQMLTEAVERSEELVEQRLAPQSVRPGMVLTRDLMNARGILILPTGQMLTENLVNKLRSMVEQSDTELLLYVAPESMKEAEGEGDDADRTVAASAS